MKSKKANEQTKKKKKKKKNKKKKKKIGEKKNYNLNYLYSFHKYINIL